MGGSWLCGRVGIRSFNLQYRMALGNYGELPGRSLEAGDAAVRLRQILVTKTLRIGAECSAPVWRNSSRLGGTDAVGAT